MFKNLLTAAAILAGLSGAAQAAWPERPVTMIVPWAAGGGTDAVARVLAAGLEKELGKPVNIVNRVGGSGVVGHTEIINARPDGYTIGLATAELATYYWSNTSQFTYNDVAPIALVNFDPAAVHVAKASEWKTLPDLLAAVKKAPAGTYKITAPIGAAYHLAVAGLFMGQGIDPKSVVVVPAQGAAPGFQELASGGVHMAPFSLPEAKAMIDAGMVTPLAVLSANRLPAFGSVPTVKETIGAEITGGAWRGVVAPKALPPEIAARLVEAVEKVVNGTEFKTFMNSNGYGIAWEKQEGFRAFMANVHQRNGEIMKALGLRQRD